MMLAPEGPWAGSARGLLALETVDDGVDGSVVQSRRLDRVTRVDDLRG
jgi:hypothetical protein